MSAVHGWCKGAKLDMCGVDLSHRVEGLWVVSQKQAPFATARVCAQGVDCVEKVTSEVADLTACRNMQATLQPLTCLVGFYNLSPT